MAAIAKTNEAKICGHNLPLVLRECFSLISIACSTSALQLELLFFVLNSTTWCKSDSIIESQSAGLPIICNGVSWLCRSQSLDPITNTWYVVGRLCRALQGSWPVFPGDIWPQFATYLNKDKILTPTKSLHAPNTYWANYLPARHFYRGAPAIESDGGVVEGSALCAKTIIIVLFTRGSKWIMRISLARPDRL